MSKPDAAKSMRDRAVAALNKAKGKVPSLPEKISTPRKASGREPETPRLRAPTTKAPPRLPTGSCFMVKFDATENCWSGTLHIGDGPSAHVFRGSASAVFKLLEKLDRMYRQWLEQQAAE